MPVWTRRFHGGTPRVHEQMQATRRVCSHTRRVEAPVFRISILVAGNGLETLP